MGREGVEVLSLGMREEADWISTVEFALALLQPALLIWMFVTPVFYPENVFPENV